VSGFEAWEDVNTWRIREELPGGSRILERTPRSNSAGGTPACPIAKMALLLLKLGAAGRAREGNDVTNVWNTSDKHEHAFKTETKA
jgi:hypothetical protein